MHLGALLVLLGVIAAALDYALGHYRSGGYRGGLLHVAVILVGIGVLVGSTALSTS